MCGGRRPFGRRTVICCHLIRTSAGSQILCLQRWSSRPVHVFNINSSALINNLLISPIGINLDLLRKMSWKLSILPQFISNNPPMMWQTKIYVHFWIVRFSFRFDTILRMMHRAVLLEFKSSLGSFARNQIYARAYECTGRVSWLVVSTKIILCYNGLHPMFHLLARVGITMEFLNCGKQMFWILTVGPFWATLRSGSTHANMSKMTHQCLSPRWLI